MVRKIYHGSTDRLYLVQAKLLTAAGLRIPVAFFGLIAAALGKPILNRFRQYGVPPGTTVSECFTFSRDRRKLLEPSRRRFEVRIGEFAGMFRDANQAKLWDRSLGACRNKENDPLWPGDRRDRCVVGVVPLDRLDEFVSLRRELVT